MSQRLGGSISTFIHECLVQHHSDIKLNKSTSVAEHFNNSVCGDPDTLTITLVELIPKKTVGDLLPMKELLAQMERDQLWIAQLNTKPPQAMNKTTELPPPICFISTFF